MVDTNKSVVVIGAAGMLGREVAGQLKAAGVRVTEASWPEKTAASLLLDITDAEAVNDFLAGVKPAAVINCAAFTDVDGAESSEAAAQAVNANGPGNLARACKTADCRLVHVSTDYVFDGQGNRPYLPSDQTSPQTAYGRTKLAGEVLIAEEAEQWCIVRTSWLFGSGGRNFVDTIVKLAGERQELKVVNDQVGCPTYAPDLAKCLIDLAAKDAQGIYHFCNGPACSWYDLAGEAVRLSGCDCRVIPCSSAEFPRPATRPAYSVLDCKSAFTILGRSARSWQEALAEHLGVSEN